MELQHTIKESAEKLQVFIVCPGLAKDDLSVSFDKKEGILEIAGAPKKGAGISDIIDLEISGKMTISPKYRSKTVAAIVKNGIAIIEFGLAEDVKVVEVGE